MEKRLLLIFVALLTVIGSFAQGKYVTVNGLKYFLRSDSKEAILFANFYSGDITVPEKIKDEGVEYTVTTFADKCFENCTGLTSITIPSSVTSLGDFCFSECSSLTRIAIPESVTWLGGGCFRGCKSLTNITIPSSVTSLTVGCFEGCTGLTSITIPESVTRLSGENFRGCTGLTSITIPSSVTWVGESCFEDCKSLTSINIPSSVTVVGNRCFKNCSGLTSITIPSSVTSVGIGCFYGCSGLTSIAIPSSVTSLGEECFRGCKSLTSINIPSSVTSLPYHCFDGCSGLTSITIPSSVTSLGTCCFESCTRLTSITIPSSVTSLPYNCFSGCSGLTSITIPSSVTSLGKECFRGCTNLSSITCKNPTPPGLGDADFDNNTYLVSTLYVPDVEAYKNAKGWKNFKYIKKITSGGDDKPAEQCAKPTIGYADGHLKFTDATEGAKYHCTLTCSDVQSDKLYEDGDVSLAACYDISVYATADGYKPSDKATAKLYWVKADGNLTTDNINTSKMRGVVVTSDGGIVTVSGLSDGEKVEFYATDGKLIGSQKAVSSSASIATSEQIVICKVVNSSIKIIVK